MAYGPSLFPANSPAPGIENLLMYVPSSPNVNRPNDVAGVRHWTAKRITDPGSGEARLQRRVQIVERRRPKAGAPVRAQQQLAHRLPSKRDLGIHGAAEVVVVVVAHRDLRFESGRERNARF